jgi:hypothetical protein
MACLCRAHGGHLPAIERVTIAGAIKALSQAHLDRLTWHFRCGGFCLIYTVLFRSRYLHFTHLRFPIHSSSASSSFLPSILLSILRSGPIIMAEVMHEKEAVATEDGTAPSPPITASESELVNASGHVQEVDRK